MILNSKRKDKETSPNREYPTSLSLRPNSTFGGTPDTPRMLGVNDVEFLCIIQLLLKL